jgi:hypothetical protein
MRSWHPWGKVSRRAFLRVKGTGRAWVVGAEVQFRF